MTPIAVPLPLIALLFAKGPVPRSDTDVLAQAKGGDPSAFDALVGRHQTRVYNLAYRLVRNREDAEDITQEAFFNTFKALPRLQEEGAFAHWLNRIVINLCYSRLRSRRRRPETLVDPLLLPEVVAGQEEWSLRELAATVTRALAQIPLKYRLAVTAYYLQGRSYDDAARLVGVPVRTFKTHLHRARRLLRALLQEESKEVLL